MDLRGVKVKLPDLLGRLEAIHNRHVAVHENEFVVGATARTSAWVHLVPYHSVLNKFEGLLTIECTIRFKLESFLDNGLQG